MSHRTLGHPYIYQEPLYLLILNLTRQDSKLVFVQLTDLNDNIPQFENSPYEVNISEVRVVISFGT